MMLVMRHPSRTAILLALPLLLTSILGGQTTSPPAWAYPVMDPGFQRPPDDGRKHRVQGSDKAFTVTEINDPFSPPDWYPSEHPLMPPTVAHGRTPDVRACAQCHMPHGLGHPESSGLAGLSANYTVQQMADFKSGKRKSLVAARSASMITIAAAITEAEVREAAEYFSKLKATKWIRIVETETVPKTFVGAGNMRHAVPNGGNEPLGQRIIEIPENSELAELRDSHSGFVAYVPVGAPGRGRELVTNGGDGKTVPCAICHGSDLKGLGDTPPLAGRSPIYAVRQMLDIQRGSRTGAGADLMTDVVAKLSETDMLDIAAYLAGIEP
jgi:cytochrome c553